jgi:nitrite reductase/ring-hydroxylating ferredoxin subunit
VLHQLLDRLEHAEPLDRLADPIDQVTRPLLRSPGASRLLSGAWLGHRLHPMLTDAVIGPWLSASVIDLVGGKAGRPAARRLVGIGVISAVPTAAAGLHDWLDYGSKVRRDGLVHALANTIGLLLQIASWVARSRGDHRRGAALSAGAMAASGAGAYIGGHMSFVLGAGVERSAFSRAPTDWVAAVSLDQLDRDGRASVDVDGTQMLIVRDGQEIRALADTCNHAGCSLADGEISDGAITCTCHGSRFRLADGHTLAGPAAAAQPAYATRLRAGMVEVREV